MSFNLSFPTIKAAEPDEEQTSTFSAAYPDPSIAGAVVDDLERAGLRPTVIEPLGPWTLSALPDPGSKFFEHSLITAATGALALGTITALASVIWLDGRHWLVYAGLGFFVGALTGWIGSAMSATAHPPRREDLLAHPGGGLTIEVEAGEPRKARLAESVMGRHEPILFTARTKPGPRSPSERVMWEHDQGLSPLEALSVWVEGRDRSSRSAAPPRGRHLESHRLRS
ncbi:MAG TPA: hypothetical protein VE027_12070 [Acidimicrobiia bacterium]|jgi:hypothetical protein|nr:hypothetical protein [Acidimicrobiia bacterium]HYJ25735.1 hypothetical protein [Acidimicrobiia bacterium]